MDQKGRIGTLRGANDDDTVEVRTTATDNKACEFDQQQHSTAQFDAVEVLDTVEVHVVRDDSTTTIKGIRSTITSNRPRGSVNCVNKNLVNEGVKDSE